MEYRIGDELDFRLKIHAIDGVRYFLDPRGLYIAQKKNGPGNFIVWEPGRNEIKPINHVPAPEPPLAKGDRVIHKDKKYMIGEVLSTYENKVWVKFEGFLPRTLSNRHLQRVKNDIE